MASITAFALSLLAITAAASPQYSFDDDSTTTYAFPLPTGPVMAITVPGGIDDQVLIGSVVGTANALTTVAVGCPQGSDPSECDFDPPVTITAGASTLRYVITYGEDYTVDQACQYSEIGGECQVTEMGDAAYFVTATDVDYATVTGTTSTVTTTAFGADQLTTFDVTLVGGQTAGLSVVSTATATGIMSNSESTDFSFETTSLTRSSTRTSVTRTTSSSSTASTSTHSSGSASASVTASTLTHNAAATLVPGAAGLGLVGLAALLL